LFRLAAGAFRQQQPSGERDVQIGEGEHMPEERGTPLRARSGRARRAGALLALAVAATALVAGCGGSSNDGGGRLAAGEGTDAAGGSTAEVAQVKWAYNASLQALNVITAPDATSGSIVANVAQGLLAYGKDGDLEPALASSWRQVSPTVYRYTLRRGVRFSNGEPVTPDDVVGSMRNAMDPRTGGASASFYLSVRSIEETAPHEITVTLRQPDVAWKFTPAHYSGWVYEQDAMRRAGSKFGGPQGIPIGSGPYKLTSISSDGVTLVRNTHYRGPATPTVERVAVDFIADDATRLAAMQSGDVDGTFLVPLQDTPQWQAVPSLELLSVGSPNQAYMFFNTTRAPFDDVHVRRALMYAFNREAVVRSLLHGNARVAYTIVPPQLWSNTGLAPEEVEARRGELGPTYPYDMEKARQELAQSRHPRGFDVSVKYTGTYAEIGAGMQVLAESLKELGVDLRLDLITDADFAKLFVPRPDFDLVAGVGAADYPDPLGLMNQTLCSCQAVPNGFNMSGYVDRQLDELLAEAAAAEAESPERVDTIVETLAIANEQLPFTSLWWDNSVAAVNRRLVLTDYGFWSSFLTPWMANIRAAS
jgi:peptide/nickel transport system substrate-binding protein